MNENTAVWDGKDLAVIQLLTARLPREHGRPAAEVDEDWHLTVFDCPVPVGATVIVFEDGQVEIEVGA